MKREKKVVKEIKTPFKELSFGQKIGYIFGYYKYYFLTAIILIATVIAMVNAFRRNNYETDFNMVIVDGRMTGDTENEDKITTEFTKYLGIDGKKHRVICDFNYHLKSVSGDQDIYYSQTKIYVMASTGDLDGYLVDQDNIDYFSNDEELFLCDLRSLLSEEELSRISDSIVYYTKKDGTKIPYAVNLSNTKIAKDTDLTIENPCYGVVVTAPNRDNGAAFIRYAFDL